MFKKFVMFAIFCGLITAGCAKKQTVMRDDTYLPPPVIDDAASKEEASARYTDWTQAPEIGTVYFDYDKAELQAAARDILQKNAEYIKANPSLNVIVEGHCDERGTIEYNLALGQRRASAIREYYGKVGVPVSKIATISYGEEKPENPAHTESSWAKNRRGVTKVRITAN